MNKRTHDYEFEASSDVERIVDHRIEGLASDVLSKVILERADICADGYETCVQTLAAAFIHDDPDVRRAAVACVIDGGVSAYEFITSHAGDTASLLGDLWADNKISFVDVSIGTARIQETVRSLAARTRHTDDIGGRPEILMIAPSVEDHLLGIFVATEILEAHGCFVHVALDHSDRELAALVRSKRFSMIGLTVSSRKTVFEAGRIIKTLRKVSTSSTPIVIGGGEATYDSKDIAAATGADFVVSNPLEALKLCKIDCDANAKLRIA